MFKRSNRVSQVQVATDALVRQDDFSQRVWQTPAALALAALALILPACAPNNVGTEASRNVSTEEVTEETSDFIGQEVTIRSEVVGKIGTSSFTLQDERLFSSEPIVVVNVSGIPFVLPVDDDVEIQATGELQRFRLADIQREYNLALDPQAYGEYENQPVILAESLALAPKAGEISENPSRYYGRNIAIQGEVEEIMANNSFTLQDREWIGGENLLVLNVGEAATTPLQDGQKMVVTGELRPMVIAEIERDYDLTWDGDLQRKLEAEYQDRPVLIAEKTYPLTVPQTTP